MYNAGHILKNDGNLDITKAKTGYPSPMYQCKTEPAVDIVSLLIFDKNSLCWLLLYSFANRTREGFFGRIFLLLPTHIVIKYCLILFASNLCFKIYSEKLA